MNLDSTLILIQRLKETGLTANEANIYITLQSIGQNPASVIAKRADLNRSSCYTILDSLMKKGFIQQAIKNNIAYFNASDPKCILQQLKNQKFKIDENIQNIDNLVNQFQSLQNNYTHKPKVVFFEGKAGLINIMEDSLTSSETLRAYASLSELTALLPNYFPNYYKRRTEKNISVKAIYPANKESYLHKKRDQIENRESRLIPAEFNFHLDILIYDNKVAITSLKEKFGLLIESKEMAIAQKKIFDLVWKATKKYDTVMTKLMQKKFNPNKKTPVKVEGFM